MKIFITVVLTILLISGLFPQIHHQKSMEEPGDSLEKKPMIAEEKPGKPDKKDLPAFVELIKGYDVIPGLFDLYWNPDKNLAYLSVDPDQYGTIYLCNITRQSGDASSFDSGAMLSGFPFMLNKLGTKIQLIEINTRYRADEDTPMARAIAQDLPNSIILNANIASDPDSISGKILLDLKEFFLNDRLTMVSYITGEWKKKYNFDKDNSQFESLKSFPENTEIGVALHFISDKPHGSITLADSRSMLHRYHFSLSAIPESDYQPRIADDRVGHFLTYFQDYSSVETDQPYTHYINRWNLVKIDPSAGVSEPVQPIVYWIENTTPEKYRAAIAKGILMWNEAFERIGFRNAIEARVMPDDADWDPADVRYHTVRWIVQPGGGYAVGPSRANPFSGELYDADVRISSDFVRHFYREFEEFITPLSLINLLDGENESNLELAEAGLCSYAEEKHRQMAFSANYLLTTGQFTEQDLNKFVSEGLTDLVVHEVGHTLGLRHNFRASHIYSLERIRDKEFTNDFGISGSVMDYHPINLSPEGEPQGTYYHTTLGFYDYWAIEYAYRSFDSTTFESEDQMLDAIASRVAEPLLAYCTDEEARGYSIRGMDPSCSLYDMTSDPLEYYQIRVDMVKKLWSILPDTFEKDQEKYSKIRAVFSQGIGEYTNMSRNVPKYIGGIYAYRDHVGDPGDRLPFHVVPAAEQRQALYFLIQNLFERDAFHFSPDLLNKLAPSYYPDFQGTIWNRSRWDYPIHDVVSGLQTNAITRIYSESVLNRVQDNEVKFPEGDEPFTMDELFQTTTRAIWSELDQRKNINSYRRRLQQIHLQILIDILLHKEKDYPRDAVSLARADLDTIYKQVKRLKTHPALDTYSKAHLVETEAKIEAAFAANVERDM